MISFLFQYGEKEYITDIKESKGLLKFITLVDYNSHFQIPKFLNNVSFPFDINYYQKNLSNKIKNLKLNWENCCFIHVRRGDYINWPSIENPAVLNVEWYLNAMNILRNEKKIEKFLLCSDDIEYCKDTLLKEKNVFLFNENVFEDLLIMSKCKHRILSGSSLSCWAAFISKKGNF